jgi:hypothetical protein
MGIETAARFLVEKILANKFTEREAPTGIVKPGAPQPPVKKESNCC